MALELRKATRRKLKARLGISGASGSGKTYSALRLAYGLCGDWSKIALIDTEGGRGELYVNTNRHTVEIGEYNCLPLDAPFAPQRFTEAITVCERAGMSVIIVDSLSHAWAGSGGMLEIKDGIAKAGKGNDYTAWRDVTPMHTALVEKLLRCEAHLIVCTRAKTEYVLEEQTRNGRTTSVPRKIGMAPVFRDGLEYELTAFFDISPEHVAMASKDNTGLFDMQPGILTEKHGTQLRAWLETGEDAKPTLPPLSPQEATGRASTVLQTQPPTGDDKVMLWLETQAKKAGYDDLTAACLEYGVDLDALRTSKDAQKTLDASLKIDIATLNDIAKEAINE